jgi:hypothetical protein
LLHGISFFIQTVYDGLVFVKTLASLNQFKFEFAHHLQGFQVVAANFAAYIARPAGEAGINDVPHRIGISALSFDKGPANRIPAAGGVTVEIMVGNAGAVFGKPPALHLVKRNPLAVGTLTASIHFRGKIFQSHFTFSFASVVKSRVFRDSSRYGGRIFP